MGSMSVKQWELSWSSAKKLKNNLSENLILSAIIVPESRDVTMSYKYF